MQLIERQRLDDAIALCHEALRLEPSLVWPHTCLALALLNKGDAPAAARHAHLACDAEPGNAGLLVNLARTLLAAGRHEAAFEALDQAAAVKPDWPEPLLLKAEMLASRGMHAAAADGCRAVLAHHPAHADAKFVLAASLLHLQQAGEAVSLMDQVRAARPTNANDAITGTSYVQYLSPPPPPPGQPVTRDHVLSDPLASLDAHRACAQAVARYNPPAWRPVPRTLDPLATRRLRVGIISPDLRDHSVASFIEPFFEHRDRGRIELFAYYAAKRGDAVTRRFEASSDHWRSLERLSRDDLGKAVAADQLDVLLELGGLFQGSVLDIARSRLAPVVATYLGYPCTTGVRAISHRLVDALTDPPGIAEAHASESLVRLAPCFVCYKPPANAPDVAPAPCIANGRITFGSFNNLRKINRSLLALWCHVLEAVPGSTLLIKAAGLQELAAQALIRDVVQSRGVDPARLTLVGYIDDPAGHLGAYRLVDIALDTIPYNGTTTTCEALWMGVPTITMEGNSHVSRVGKSLMHAAGLPELVAVDVDGYIAAASRVARDHAALAALRTTLRARMATSPLCDAPAFCRGLERTLLDLAQAAGVT
jgi:predicted O-linked N-acetylglucosamine transferase (SPINDLY family)